MSPTVKYGAILADPPWSFRTYSEKGTGRSAVSHYDCLNLDALKALPIVNSAATDCALFLWVTDPMLESGLELIRAWGFTYKTVAFYWVKLNKNGGGFFTGMGYWTRSNPEQCLMATRGRPQRIHRGVPKLIVAPRREHSRKPDESRDRIQSLVPGPYLELFSRETCPGWDATGDQAGLFDGGHKETRRQPSRLNSPASLVGPGEFGNRIT